MIKQALSTDILIKYMSKALRTSLGKQTIKDLETLPEPLKTKIVRQLAPQVELIRKKIR